MLVDKVATENFMLNELIQKVEALMLSYTVLDKLKHIMTAGQQLILGTAAGIPPFVTTHESVKKNVVRPKPLIIPGVGRNCLLSADAVTR